MRYRFERLWNAQEPDWIALEVPEAARRQLLRYRPATAPTRDPLEREVEPRVAEGEAVFAGAPELQRERFPERFSGGVFSGSTERPCLSVCSDHRQLKGLERGVN
ncbi:MAG: hypothetical protein ACETWR_21775 [Anaerolineae bacterium]